ncbi:MAG: hypothetical protein M3017_03060 [Actinomycetota bacterium]|nr:hypothetical protein [Actinomycetota bacterium]
MARLSFVSDPQIICAEADGPAAVVPPAPLPDGAAPPDGAAELPPPDLPAIADPGGMDIPGDIDVPDIDDPVADGCAVDG